MTEQEIEKLREKLGSEYSVKRQNGAITVELVDIWEGVDFYESHLGIVKPISESFRKKIKSGVKFLINPSTEAAYVEQLKAKAKELYGEIKNGDRFILPWIGNGNERNIHLEGKYDFYYYKKSDILELHGFPLYNQGKWAKKIERVRVNVYSVHYSREPIEYMGELIPSDTIDCTVHFTIEGSSPKIILKDDFRQLLSKCLEDYLNKIP